MVLGAWCWFISFLLWEEIMAVNIKVKPYMVELLLLRTLFALFLQTMMNDNLATAIIIFITNCYSAAM